MTDRVTLVLSAEDARHLLELLRAAEAQEFIYSRAARRVLDSVTSALSLEEHQ